MIIGIGIDLIEVDRIQELVSRHGDGFLKRVLHAETDRARFTRGDGGTHLAGLFAVKEAVMKALGTGMAGARFAEIRVVHLDSGQPTIALEGLALEHAQKRGVTGWQVSITHTKQTAAAVAIALG